MKTLLKAVIFCTALLLSSNSSEAQILKKLKKSVQQASEEVLVEKAAEEVAEETEKALDTLLDEKDQKQQQEQMDALFGQGADDIQTEKVYSFDTNVSYEMSFEANGESTLAEYSMWFSKSQNYMGTQLSNTNNKKGPQQDIPSSMMTILDDKNKATIILMEEQKIAQVISMDRIKDIAVQEGKEQGLDTDFESFEKTGKKKQILGYDCHEYRSANADLDYTFWITNDLELYQKNMFYNLSKSLGGKSFGKVPSSAKGFMMEMSFENKSTNEKGRMLVKDIQERNKTVDMSAYQFMNMSQMMK